MTPTERKLLDQFALALAPHFKPDGKHRQAELQEWADGIYTLASYLVSARHRAHLRREFGPASHEIARQLIRKAMI